MTKADIVANIADETGLERIETLKVIEAFMSSVKSSLTKGDNVYLRGFGSFWVPKVNVLGSESDMKSMSGVYAENEQPEVSQPQGDSPLN